MFENFFFFLIIFLNLGGKKFLWLFHPNMGLSYGCPICREKKKGNKKPNTSLQMEQDCLLNPVSHFSITKCIYGIESCTLFLSYMKIQCSF